MNKNRILQPLYEQMRPGNLVSRMRRAIDDDSSELSLQVGKLDTLAKSSGVVDGNLIVSRSTDVTTTDPTNTGFTGTFMSGNPQSFSGTDFQLGGVNAGALQWGVRASDGVFVSGGEDAQVDENGITLVPAVSETPGAQIKWATGGTTNHFLIDVRTPDPQGLTGLKSYYSGSARGYISFTADSSYGNVTIFGEGVASQDVYINVDAQNTKITLEGGLSIDYPDTHGNVYTGTWSPSVYNLTNLDAVDNMYGYFIRVGNMVTCFGRVRIDPTTAGAIDFEMDLPIAATFGGAQLCGGVFARYDGDFYYYGGGGVSANVANNRAFFAGGCNWTAAVNCSFHFSYRIST